MIKDPFATGVAARIQEWTDSAVVVVIRHPAAVIARSVAVATVLASASVLQTTWMFCSQIGAHLLIPLHHPPRSPPLSFRPVLRCSKAFISTRPQSMSLDEVVELEIDRYLQAWLGLGVVPRAGPPAYFARRNTRGHFIGCSASLSS